MGNYFYLKNKASGVEPGFLAAFIDKELCDQILTHVLSEENIREDPVLRGLKNLLEQEQQHDKPKALRKWLIQNQSTDEVGKLAELCERERNVTRYLIKQDYTDPESEDRVTLPVSRTRNSNTVKKWTPGILSGAFRKLVAWIYSQRRRRQYSEENRNALLECIGNEIASKAHGMQCQEQKEL